MNALEALVLDLVEWVALKSRPPDEVMEVWRTSCPRLTVWEDAVDRGFVMREAGSEKSRFVRVSDAGRIFLEANRRSTEIGRRPRNLTGTLQNCFAACATDNGYFFGYDVRRLSEQKAPYHERRQETPPWCVYAPDHHP